MFHSEASPNNSQNVQYGSIELAIESFGNPIHQLHQFKRKKFPHTRPQATLHDDKFVPKKQFDDCKIAVGIFGGDHNLPCPCGDEL